MELANLNNLEDERPDITSSSADYASRFAGSVGAWFLGIQEKATLNMLQGMEGASVLDVGGGHAQIARPLVGRGFNVTVLGSAPECRRNINDLLESGKCAFVSGSLINPPFPERSFDVVVSFRIVSHLAQWPVYLASMCRIARKAVIIDFPRKRGIAALNDALFQVKKGLEGNTRTYLSFGESELIAEFNKQGFEFSRRFAQFCLPMVLHRVLKFPRLSATLEQSLRLTGLANIVGSPVILKVIRNEGN